MEPVFGRGGSNQFFDNIPGMPSQGRGNPGGFNFSPFGSGSAPGSDPYQVPGQSGYNSGGPYGPSFNAFGWPNISGTHAVPPQYPGLSNNFANWLTNQIGQGVAPYNLSVPLPTGGLTQPGQLTAGENPLLQQLQSLFSGGSSSVPGGNLLSSLASGATPTPGLSTLSTIANQGVSALPEWQAMVAQMQQGQQTGEANLREQFAGMGDLAGSPFGTAMQQYQNQYGLDINSLLGQLTQSNIQNIQMPALGELNQLQSGAAQFMQGQEQNLSQYLQGLNQQAIQNQYGEFVRTSPQYNPLIQDMLTMSGIYPPTITSGSGMGTLGGILGGGGQLAGGLASLLPVIGRL